MRHAHRNGGDLRLPPTPRQGAAILARGLFVKADKPRQIDPYIDYFGEPAPLARAWRLAMQRAG